MSSIQENPNQANVEVDELFDDLNEVMRIRIEKLNDLKEAGINPYPYSYDPTHYTEEIINNFETYTENDIVNIAGRIMSMRDMGKTAFMHVQDMKGRIQVYLRKDTLGDLFDFYTKKLDMGDIIGVKGTVFRTKTGEISIKVQELTVLTKSVRPLPEKYHGMTDKELRYRHRSVDMIMNEDVRKTFIKRAKALRAIRDFMASNGFYEIEVPVLDTKYGGGEAKPFITRVNALDTEAYLRVSPELFLKRLIVGGIDRVFTMEKSFRNEGIDRTHYPEFTLFECYMAYADYNDMMRLMENLYEYVFMTVNGSTVIEYEGHQLDFKAPWARRRMTDLVKEATGIDVEHLSKEEIIQQVDAKQINLEDVDRNELKTKGQWIMTLYEACCEKNIIQPTFVIDYPLESSPLCKVHRENPEYIERFEPFALGVELGNAYSELNDPVRQRFLLDDQAQKLRGGLETASPMDEEFAQAIEVGMPPTGGLGIGIDRLVMFLTESYSIKDVIAFPLMKR